ncbi:MAG: CRISPR-associated helicase Cas3' [Porticoccaceae bacterium]|nr:CRISPR-associated helicase Cas3' [Porticoccaceae bacterium]|tara:strand:+ start:2764 stop:4941 length:2178 start_codon:yes stop_codon:yes gene_type:complete
MINFKDITGFDPFPFQAIRHDFTKQPVLVLNVPTGSGKTETYVANWILDLLSSPSTTPKRLIIQLPLRTLVDQTAKRVREMIERVELDISTHVLMGGQIEDEFVHDPDQPAVIVGTLDQILSRQLMRPYCASRWAAPLHFATTNSNVRIVVDETQLQDLGYPTAVRLQEFYEKMGGFYARELILCSATLNADPLKGFDYGVIEVSEEDKQHPVYKNKFGREKNLHLIGELKDDEFIKLVNKTHIPGTLTLVVVNTVKKAQAVYEGINGKKMLLHSRFRKGDRERIQANLYAKDMVLVSTQVVEAGVDIDCRTLISQICPFSSAVQRAGRAGRNGTYDDCDVYFVNTKQPLPYKEIDIHNTWSHLEKLPNFNISTILENQLKDRLSPCVLTQTDFVELLCDNRVRQVEPTIAPYVRQIDDANVFVAWREEPCVDMRLVQRHEICPVPLQDVVKNVKQGWVFNDQTEVWDLVKLDNRSSIEVGKVLVIDCKEGCYDTDIGWLSTSQTPVNELEPEATANGRFWSKSQPLDLQQHLEETRDFSNEIMDKTYLIDASIVESVSRAAYLHDIGKATDHFQWFIQGAAPQPGVLLAKGDKVARQHRVPGMRHEAHSAFAALQMDEDLLVTYLVMAHHGKIRTCFNGFSFVDEEDGRIHGIKTGDVVPLIPGVTDKAITVKVPKDMDFDWNDLYQAMLSQYGVFKLVSMEAIVRNSDVRSSRLHQEGDDIEE